MYHTEHEHDVLVKLFVMSLGVKVHLPAEICTSVTKRSLWGNLCDLAARSAMALMISSQRAATSSGCSRPRTTCDGTVRTMFSNSNSVQGPGAVRSFNHSAAVVAPEKNKERSRSIKML